MKRKRGRPKKIIRGSPRKVSWFVTSPIDGATATTSNHKNGSQCCAVDCSNTSDRCRTCRFPQEPELRQRWVDRIGRPGWSPTDDSYLCEIHFEPDMWESSAEVGRVLKPDAVPSLFLPQEPCLSDWRTINGKLEVLVDEMEIEESNLFIKTEDLEPEIDMLEGDAQPETAQPAGKPFETIFCDRGFNQEQLEGVKSSRVLIKQEPLDPEFETILPDTAKPSSNKVSEEHEEGKEVCKNEDLMEEQVVDPIGTSELKTDETKTPADKRFEITLYCPICMKGIRYKRNLMLHMQKLHPTEEITEMMKTVKRVNRKGKRKVWALLESKLCTPCVSLSSVSSILSSILQSSDIKKLPSGEEIKDFSGEELKEFSVIAPEDHEPSPLMLFPPHLSELTHTARDASDMFCVMLTPLTHTTRLALKRKLMELIEAVTVRKLNPERIIIAYSDYTLKDKK